MKLKKNIKILVVADGGAASGKTTGAKLISKKYGLKFLSSGLLYRYVAYKLLQKKIHSKNRNLFLKKIISSINAKKLKNKSLFDQKVTRYTAVIAKIKKIRLLLRKYQKNFAKKNRACIEGRDIATVICPNADIKLFFRCNINIRAKRRYKELRRQKVKISLKEIKKTLKYRDYLDKSRKISPLKVTKDSIVIDSSKINKKQMLEKLSRIVERKLVVKYGRNFKRN